MPSFDITLKSDIDETYRVSRIMRDFDVKLENSIEHIRGGG